MLEWFVFAAVGKLLVYLWQIFPLPEPKKTYVSQTIHKLHLCDLCSGVWIYSILALIFGVDIIQDLFGTSNIFGQIITGAITSYVVHIFSIGIKERYGTVVI